MPEAPPPRSLLALALATWRGLLAPRRAVPILLVAAPLVAAEWYFTRIPTATAGSVLMCVAFIGVGPLAWRALMPVDRPVSARWLRVLAYGLGSALLAGGLSQLLERSAGIHTSFLTALPSIAIVSGLFAVGGFGLGRDLDLEERLAATLARADRLEREKEQAQLLALKSHLDPHFLFNTLNAIAEWTREDPLVAERAILQLAAMLRTVLGAVREARWPLSRELELVGAVLDLHGIRDPDRFSARRVGWELAPDLPVPPMLLLPLVENAMKHGPGAGHRGEVRISVAWEGPLLRVEVENPGAFGGERPGGEGLAMVRRRLALTWGDLARLEIGTTPAGRTLARLWIPEEEGR